MLILSIDLSLHAGYAVAEGQKGSEPKLIEYGTKDLGQKITSYGSYPFCYSKASTAQIQDNIKPLIDRFQPDVIVVEETSKSRAVYSQKILEFLHRDLLQVLSEYLLHKPTCEIAFLKTGDWRSSLGMAMTKQQKKDNAILRKAKRKGKVDKKKLGIKGLTTPKHVAVAYVNEKFGLKLLVKDNNTADALNLILAYLANCKICDGEW